MTTWMTQVSADGHDDPVHTGNVMTESAVLGFTAFTIADRIPQWRLIFFHRPSPQKLQVPP
jgi:hypothetical protein